MAEASKVSGEMYRRIFSEYYPVFVDMYHEKGFKIAQEIGDQCGEGTAYRSLGNVYLSLGSCRRAIEYHEKGLKIAQEIGDQCGEGTAYRSLGNVYLSLGSCRRAIEYHEKGLKIAQEIGDQCGEGTAYRSLGNVYLSLGSCRRAIEYHEKGLKIAQEIGYRSGEGTALGDYQKAIEYQEKLLKIAQEIGDRSGEGAAYGLLGVAYRSLGEYQKAIDYLEKSLKIAQDIGEQDREGRVYHNIGTVYFSLEQFENAADNFSCSVEAFNAVRSCLKSKDDWKIKFRELYETTCSGSWKSLLRIEKLDEALFAAERGRGQTLSDNLLIQYKLPASLSVNTIDPKETISRLLTEVSLPILFLAIEGLTINIWFLSRGKKVIFRKGRLVGDRTKNDPVRALLQSCLKKIRTEVIVRCEDRTLDELTRDCPSSREVCEEVKKPFQFLDNHFKAFYDAVIGPVVELLGPQDDELVIVPDGALCFTPWAAVTESIRIRTVPSLTSYQLILGVPEGHHKKAGALLVGNPCLKELKKPLDDLPGAQVPIDIETRKASSGGSFASGQKCPSYFTDRIRQKYDFPSLLLELL
ncbi:PREDICTED: tetratricopeptide repeat protein 28-like [Acropora digitifera]|uniref:tetratricopeptide repeat protein 28-like n=1 Tax=Acropora digitifera TaxID=70779 RepID=UPI00077A8954|nr:PREDICTED: tetratricopeptide repeat protein 28-like [Acropora digitifera]